MKSSLTSRLISLHSRLQHSTGPNTFTLRLPVPSNLNIPEWCRHLVHYPDKSLCDFLEFGWPVRYSCCSPPVQSTQNHGSARSYPTVIDQFLSSECELGATCGPFVTNPLSVDISISPLQIAYSRTGKPRVVVDLSYPPGQSVNCGIPRDTSVNRSLFTYPVWVPCSISSVKRASTVISSRQTSAELTASCESTHGTIIFWATSTVIPSIST